MSINPPVLPFDLGVSPRQCWTLDGRHPIVDGRYVDSTTGEVREHTGPSIGGPPSVAVYWHNRLAAGQPEPIFGISSMERTPVTEYVIRIGNLLGAVTCTVNSLIVTKFSVTIIVQTPLSKTEFSEALVEHRLVNGDAF